jgi:hypothetical protein
MKPQEKKKDLPMTPLTKEEIAERSEQIFALTKRIPKVTQALEIEGLDIIMYLKALSEGKFPAEHIMSVSTNLEKAIGEVESILNKWNKIFEKELGEKLGKST